MKNTKLTPLEKQLKLALKLAYKHLLYCGYGDSYERECAKDMKLEKTIEDALKAAGVNI